MLPLLVHSESTGTYGHIPHGPIQVVSVCPSLCPGLTGLSRVPALVLSYSANHTPWGLPSPVLPSCFYFSFCRTPSAWLFLSSDIIRNIQSCNCLMVGFHLFHRDPRSSPPQTHALGLAKLTRDSCAVGSAWHYKELSPRYIIRKERWKRWPQE